MLKVDDTAIKTIVNNNTIRWLDGMVRHTSYGNQEQVEVDCGWNTVLFHSHINRKAGGLRTSHDKLNTHVSVELLKNGNNSGRAAKFA